MLVRTFKDELARTGLQIGEVNARRYFNRRKPWIELELDDLHIQCTLSPDFWQGHPAIHDPRLSEWLEFKVARRGVSHGSVLVSMIPTGTSTFVIRANAEMRYQAFGADVTRPRQVQSEPVLEHSARRLVARSVA